MRKTRREREREGGVGLFAGWPELIITDGYQPVNSDTPLRASAGALSVSPPYIPRPVLPACTCCVEPGRFPQRRCVWVGVCE